MAKIMKDTREVIDVDTELEKIKKSQKEIGNKGKKKEDSKKTKKTSKSKSTKKVKKQNGIIKFFKEVKNEIAKVKWPSKKDMIKYSIATIVFVLFFAVFFYMIDLVVALLKEVF